MHLVGVEPRTREGEPTRFKNGSAPKHSVSVHRTRYRVCSFLNGTFPGVPGPQGCMSHLKLKTKPITRKRNVPKERKVRFKKSESGKQVYVPVLVAIMEWNDSTKK